MSQRNSFENINKIMSDLESKEHGKKVLGFGGSRSEADLFVAI